jgi:hypothetical protein
VKLYGGGMREKTSRIGVLVSNAQHRSFDARKDVMLFVVVRDSCGCRGLDPPKLVTCITLPYGPYRKDEFKACKSSNTARLALIYMSQCFDGRHPIFDGQKPFQSIIDGLHLIAFE